MPSFAPLRAVALAAAMLPTAASAQIFTLDQTLSAPDASVASESFGYTLRVLGDVNGDGVDDLLSGGPYAAVDGLLDAGRVYVLDGATADSLYTVTGLPGDDGRFGEYLAAVGDVTGDGVPDFAVTAVAEGGLDQGAAYLFSGADGALVRELVSPTPAAFGYYGSSIAAAGDLNGDGVSEVFVSSAVEQPSFSSGGTVHLFDGATGAVLYTVVAPFELGQSGSAEYFGKTVARLDDLDGDGLPEFAVMTRNTSPGRVDIFSGADGSPLDALIARPTAIDFGLYLGTYPDLDGDGIDEILVGATGDQSGPPGELYLYDGATRAPLRTFLPPAPNDGGFGSSVALLPDLDGGGLPDLAVGSPGSDASSTPNSGRVYVLSAETGDVLSTLESPNPTFIGVFGYSVLWFDLGADGATDLLVGAPLEEGFEGSIYVYGADIVAAEPSPVSGLALSPVVPNPASGAAALTLTLTAPATVRADVLDALGRRVATLHEGPLAPGVHPLALTAGLVPGVYTVRVAAGAEVQTVRMTVAR